MLRYTYTVCLYTHSLQNVWLRLWGKILRWLWTEYPNQGEQLQLRDKESKTNSTRSS
jgi:hypothetical protein